MDEVSTLDFPLIIANGASQISKQYYSDLLNMPKDDICLYPDVVAQKLNGFCLNVAVPGSSNRRLVRRTLYECIKQLNTNPGQPIIVLLELTFDIRDEIWHAGQSTDPGESDFQSLQLARTQSWWQNRTTKLGTDDRAVLPGLNSVEQKYLQKWQEGSCYFYSPWARNINLYTDIIMLTGFLKQHGIQYAIYRGNPCLPLDPEHLLDSFKAVLHQDSGVFDLFDFSFTGWCVDRGHVPLDYQDQPHLGHPSLLAHEEFGIFLTNHLQDR